MSTFLKKAVWLISNPNILMRNSGLFVLLALPRSVYIYLTEQTTGDTALYIQIAANILDGCGFSAASGTNSCTPLVGGYFPAYPYLLALLKFVDLSHKSMAIVVGVGFVLSILYLRRSLEITLRNPRLALWISIGVGLSPLSLGFSRFLFIEPILVVFSILLISQCLFIIYRKKKLDLVGGICLIVLSTYFKPTAVIFVAPLVLSIVIAFGLKYSIKPFLIAGVTLFIAVLPWELRNWSLSGQSLLTAKSNIYPPIKHYQSWVHSWAITEYENAHATFPAFTNGSFWTSKTLDDIVIRPNMFLSSAEAQEALEIIEQHSLQDQQWTPELDEKFNILLYKRSEDRVFLDYLVLRLLQVGSVLLHPGNSWGFPLSLSLSSSGNSSTSIIGTNIAAEIIPQVLGKLALFLYRVITLSLFTLAACQLIWHLMCHLTKEWGPTRNKGVVLFSLNDGQVVTVLALTTIVSALALFIFLFNGNYHYYLVYSMPWIEISAFFFLHEKIQRWRI